MTLLPEVKSQLNSTGVAVSGDIGGLKKTKYWTPDGKEILAVPSILTFKLVDKKKKTVRDVTVDRNLEKGWLLQPPTKVKPHCSGCGKWHDTEQEIDTCITKKKTFNEEWEERVKKERKDNGEGLKQEVAELKSEMVEIKSLLIKLLKKE